MKHIIKNVFNTIWKDKPIWKKVIIIIILLFLLKLIGLIVLYTLFYFGILDSNILLPIQKPN